jgi:glutaredoxin
MKIVVWSRYNCTYCDQAKNLLENKNLSYEERKIGDGWTREDLLELLPNARSVPQIFVNDNHIGGYDDLVKYFETEHP